MTTPPKKTAQQLRDEQAARDKAVSDQIIANAPKGTKWIKRRSTKKPKKG